MTKEVRFATLLRQYNKKTYYAIRKMVISHEDADDLNSRSIHNSLAKA